MNLAATATIAPEPPARQPGNKVLFDPSVLSRQQPCQTNVIRMMFLWMDTFI
jgi:hypothetical protein